MNKKINKEKIFRKRMINKEYGIEEDILNNEKKVILEQILNYHKKIFNYIKLKKYISVFSIFVLCLSLVSCSPSNNDSKINNTKNRLIYGSNDYTSINPALYEHGEINSLIFDGLTSHDEQNNVVPSLAKSWTYNKNEKTYTFKLREDVKWHDKEQFTANDVKFTIESIQDPKNLSEIASNYEDIESVDVVDDFELKIKMKAENTAILDYLSVGILPEHILRNKNLTTDSFNQNPIGTGAYKLTQWNIGENIVLDKNEDYYKFKNNDDANNNNANNDKIQVNSNIDRIIFKIIPSDKSKATQLLSGEIDLAQISPLDLNLFKDKKGLKTYIMKTADYRGIMYNHNGGFFKEKIADGLPNALSYAINREEILKSVLKGYGEIAYSPLQKGEFNNENINKFEYDQNKAKEEIKKLGWKLGKDGIYEKNNKKLSFEITANENDTVRVNIAKIASQQLRDIGVDANAKIVSEIDWKNQDATIIGWGSPFDPDDHTYKVFSTGQGSNFSGYSNKKVDELLKKARESTSKEEKLKLYDEFQEEMTKDMPYTFLVYIDAIYVGKDDIQGITENKILGHHGVGIFNNITNFSIK